MSNIDFFKKEVAKSFKYHIVKELTPRILKFIKTEVNNVLDNKIKDLRKNNDNTVKPQHNIRKSKNTDSIKRIK